MLLTNRNINYHSKDIRPFSQVQFMGKNVLTLRGKTFTGRKIRHFHEF